MIYNNHRRKSKCIKVGSLCIGGNSPISVQSMTNTDTHNFDSTLAQIKALENKGCDIVRITVPDIECVNTVYKLKLSDVKIPIVADIHFDYKLAVECANAGIDKIRINPGNIGSEENIKKVALICREKNIPIRIGVNGGSLEKKILAKYERPTPEALAESAQFNVQLLEKFDFENIVISVKSSDLKTMIEANRILAQKFEYPLHLGVTEAGNYFVGSTKSAIGIGSLLSDGIGDTIRVSLTADPLLEIDEGDRILTALGLSSKRKMNIVSCPTCGRTKIDLIKLADSFELAAKESGILSKNITVAIMGCAVNGPGEASHADIGIAGGIGEALLFKKGNILRKIPESEIIETLIREIKSMD